MYVFVRVCVCRRSSSRSRGDYLLCVCLYVCLYCVCTLIGGSGGAVLARGETIMCMCVLCVHVHVCMCMHGEAILARCETIVYVCMYVYTVCACACRLAAVQGQFSLVVGLLCVCVRACMYVYAWRGYSRFR